MLPFPCTCTIHNQQIPLENIVISCDEGSCFWLANISIAQLSDFAAAHIGDNVSVVVGEETFAFVVDGKNINIEQNNSYSLSCISPVALKNKPYAQTVDVFFENIGAKALVESLLGQITWSIQDWIIKKITLADTYPLEAAKLIVTAIGAVIESKHDGSLLVRMKHADPLTYQQNIVHNYIDSDIFSITEQVQTDDWFNAVVISNDGGTNEISIDIEEVDSNSVLLRAYTDNGTLVHSGNNQVTISQPSILLRTEIETVEFVEGTATTAHPVVSISEKTWKYDNLGEVTFNGNVLTASVGNGYSLLDLRYTTKVVEWLVTNPVSEKTQFILTSVGV